MTADIQPPAPLSPDQVAPAITKLIAGDGALIPLAEFARAYDLHRAAAKAPQLASLAAAYRGEPLALVPAITLALDRRFMLSIWATLVQQSRPALEGSELAGRIGLALAERADLGDMQGLITAKNFQIAANLWAVLYAAKATGLVEINDAAGGPRGAGTGFLVAPDLLLTAAHVVYELVDVDFQQQPPRLEVKPATAGRLQVSFHNQLNGDGKWPKEVWVAERWLVAYSPPLGVPPRLGSTAIAAAAAKQLDFALLRLAEPIGAEIGFIDITSPPDAEDGSLLLFGYPAGGSQCLWNIDQVLQIEADAGRVRHRVNSTAGMSGGPCLNAIGKAVALHEGKVDEAQPYNRAVHLRRVCDFIDLLRPGALTVREPRWSLIDVDARRDWIAAGSALAPSDAERTTWLQAVEEWASPEAADAFHPIFDRSKLQEWIDEARLEGATRRLALISGDRGTGKTFSVAILKAKLRQADELVVVLRPEAVRGPTLEGALDRVFREVTARVPPPLVPNNRPSAGTLRRDLVPPFLDQLAVVVRSRASGPKRLWLVVDVGVDSNLTADVAQAWRELWIQAAAHDRSWLRVVLIGLRSTRQDEFANAVAQTGGVFRETIQPLDLAAFTQTLESVVRAVKPDADFGRFTALVNDLWDQDVSPEDARPGHLLRAVLAALRFRRQR